MAEKRRFELIPFEDIREQPRSTRSRRSLLSLIERARALNITIWPTSSACWGKCGVIYFEGEQWAVTPYGVECRDDFYFISISRIWENEFGGSPYGWVQHMAGKEWVDLPDFVEALRVGRSLAAAQELLGPTRKPFFPCRNLPRCPPEVIAGIR